MNPILELNLKKHSNETDKYALTFAYSRSSKQDYYVYRTLYFTNQFLLLNDKLVKTAGDCIEKLLKFYLISSFPEENVKAFGHKLNAIREKCAEHDSYFNHSKLTEFCNQYSKRLHRIDGHQIFGYSDFTVMDQASFDYKQILNLLDELYLETFLRSRNGLIFTDIFEIYLDYTKAKWSYPEHGQFDQIKKIFFKENIHIETTYERNKWIIDSQKDIEFHTNYYHKFMKLVRGIIRKFNP